MNVKRSKKRGHVSKAKTVGDTLGGFFLFCYEITIRYPNLYHMFKPKESKTGTYEEGNESNTCTYEEGKDSRTCTY